MLEDREKNISLGVMAREVFLNVKESGDYQNFLLHPGEYVLNVMQRMACTKLLADIEAEGFLEECGSMDRNYHVFERFPEGRLMEVYVKHAQNYPKPGQPYYDISWIAMHLLNRSEQESLMPSPPFALPELPNPILWSAHITNGKDIEEYIRSKPYFFTSAQKENFYRSKTSGLRKISSSYFREEGDKGIREYLRKLKFLRNVLESKIDQQRTQDSYQESVAKMKSERGSGVTRVVWVREESPDPMKNLFLPPC